MMMNAWTPNMMVSPVAISREKSERPVCARASPRPTSSVGEGDRRGSDQAHLDPDAPKIMSDELGDLAGVEVLTGARCPEASTAQPEPGVSELDAQGVEVGRRLPRVEAIRSPGRDRGPEEVGGRRRPRCDRRRSPRRDTRRARRDPQQADEEGKEQCRRSRCRPPRQSPPWPVPTPPGSGSGDGVEDQAVAEAGGGMDSISLLEAKYERRRCTEGSWRTRSAEGEAAEVDPQPGS